MPAHQTVCLGSGVRIGRDVIMGPYAVVGDGAVLGDECELAEHAVLRPGTILGQRTRVDSFAVIGGDPQDFKFDPRTSSRVTLGSDVVVREGVTIHRSSVADGATQVEDGVYLMANAHIAHDCVVRKGAVLSNNVMLAGHVEVGAGAVLGGAAGIHQFVRIGAGTMVGGNAAITQDVPPFTVVVGRNGLSGLNLVGLRRSGASAEEIGDLKTCYRAVYGGGDPVVNAAEALASSRRRPVGISQAFLEFFAGGRRGFARPRRGRVRPGGDD